MGFSTLGVNDNVSFYKVCLILLNDIVESKTKYNRYYVTRSGYDIHLKTRKNHLHRKWFFKCIKRKKGFSRMELLRSYVVCSKFNFLFKLFLMSLGICLR